MTPSTKGIIAAVSVLALSGIAYYFLVYKKQDESLCADAMGDIFVYDVNTKKQMYSKKKGEWVGCDLKEYDADNSYWIAKNTKGQDILIKKSEVVTRKNLK